MRTKPKLILISILIFHKSLIYHIIDKGRYDVLLYRYSLSTMLYKNENWMKTALNVKRYQRLNAFKACLDVPGASRFQTCHAYTIWRQSIISHFRRDVMWQWEWRNLSPRSQISRLLIPWIRQVIDSFHGHQL